MAHVRMKRQIGGYRIGREWPARGELLECSDSEAASLVAAGHATHAQPPPAEAAAVVGDKGPAGPPVDLRRLLVAGSIPAVLERIGDDAAKAREALDVERDSAKPRKSLIEQLEAIASTDGGGDDGTGPADPGGPDGAAGGSNGTAAGQGSPATGQPDGQPSTAAS